MWIKRTCNVYLAFSNSNAYQCAKSTHRIYPHDSTASHFFEDVTTNFQCHKTFLVTFSSALKIPVSHCLTSQTTCTSSGHFTTNTPPRAALTWRMARTFWWNEAWTFLNVLLKWSCVLFPPWQISKEQSLWEP